MKQDNYLRKSMDLRKIRFRFLALLFLNIVAAALAAASAADARCNRERLSGFIWRRLFPLRVAAAQQQAI